MLTLPALYNRVKNLNTDEVITDSFTESTTAFEEENRKQLFEGQAKTGEITKKYKNNKYARVKNEMNPLPGLGTPDLKVTGAFYRGIRVEVSGETLNIKSTDSKGPDLEAKYKDIFGLGGVYKKEFLDTTLRPKILKKISTLTGLPINGR